MKLKLAMKFAIFSPAPFFRFPIKQKGVRVLLGSREGMGGSMGCVGVRGCRISQKSNAGTQNPVLSG